MESTARNNSERNKQQHQEEEEKEVSIQSTVRSPKVSVIKTAGVIEAMKEELSTRNANQNSSAKKQASSAKKAAADEWDVDISEDLSAISQEK